MKLSEAIRLGAVLKPQAFGTVFDGRGTCVYGAAFDAVGELPTYPCIGFTHILAHHPDWSLIDGPCPECAIQCSPAHLNDVHHWSREAIADWVATIESQEPAAEVTEREPEAVTCP